MAPTIIIHNLSPDAIAISGTTGKTTTPLSVLSSNSLTVTTRPSRCWKLTFAPSDGALPSIDAEKAGGETERVTFRVRMPQFRHSWRPMTLLEQCPWRVYCVRTSKKERTLAIIPNRDMSSYLSDIPDSVPLSACLLPGTHDTMAAYGWPFSQCQSMTLSAQLAAGIRLLDIRLSVINGALIAYHGIVSQRTPFQDILNSIHAFLTSPASSLETVIVSIKQEDFEKTPGQIFSKCVKMEIVRSAGGLKMWYLENRIPKLGEVRGRAVMLSRFGGDGEGWEGGLDGLGLHISPWPYNVKEGFTWLCKDTLVRVHDWCEIPSFLDVPEKAVLSIQILDSPQNDPLVSNTALTFFSAANIPWALPGTVALGTAGMEGINKRLGKWLLDRLGDDSGGNEKKKRVRGWTMMDFCDPDIVRMLVECNFRWRKFGEEGWV